MSVSNCATPAFTRTGWQIKASRARNHDCGRLAGAASPGSTAPVLSRLGVVVALFGMVLIGIDLAAGMPLWWTASEGLSTMVIGALMCFFARQDY